MTKLILLDSLLHSPRGYRGKTTNISLSNATNLTLLDLLLPEVTTGAIYIGTSLKLWGPETPFCGFRTCFNNSLHLYFEIHTRTGFFSFPVLFFEDNIILRVH